MGESYDFGGWATRNDLVCADGRIIRQNAFQVNDGQKVPLVWNHKHDNSENVLGHALLENRPEGVYAYGKFNDTESGQNAKKLVHNGDIDALSIWANDLKQKGANVTHGVIRELSLVLSGANPGAFIDQATLAHGEDTETEAIIYTGEELETGDFMSHSDENPTKEEEPEKDEGKTVQDVLDSMTEEQQDVAYMLMGMAKEGVTADDVNTEEVISHSEEGDGRTVQDVINSMTKEQQDVMYGLIGMIAKDNKNDTTDDSENDGGKEMKHNVFENDAPETTLTHSDEQAIIELAKMSSCGSFQEALGAYVEDDEALAHSIDDIEQLFPEYKDVYPGAPELITRDQTWVNGVINGVHKSPISRIRTRQMDARKKGIHAKGYKTKGSKKTEIANVSLLKRTTDPQTVYVKDKLNRDDIIDITDFDVVNYMYGVMRMSLEEELAMAIMVGDGREEGAEDKIEETHIRSIWHDDELYTIHQDVDIAAAKAELQGGDTSKHFGDNYIYAEAIISSALYAREQYKGTGSLTFYCTPHLLNVMLLARDLNGRRIYSSKADLAAALNVKDIETVEQFEGLTRKTKTGDKTKKLLGIFVNLNDYQVGSTKGGEITKFNQFDIDFNQEKYLIETRLSGALTRIYSAIALEEDVTSSKDSHTDSDQLPS